MINLITMAGRGKRFSDTGYTLPKPLIPVDGEPMVWRVIESLPKAKKWIFVVREEHISQFHIDEVIKKKIPEAIIVVDKDLLGGVSIFCAEEYMEDDEILIAGCDNAFSFDKEKFEHLKNENKYDCILWTYTKDKRIIESPTSWGYAILDNDGRTIKNMSVKVPISDNPFNDHVVTATFYLQSTKLLYSAIRLMIKENIKVNNEFYLDSLPVVLNQMHKKSCIFDVDLYVGWGTPKEFYEYQKIKHFFDIGKLNELDLSKEENNLWEKYFKNRAKK